MKCQLVNQTNFIHNWIPFKGFWCHLLYKTSMTGRQRLCTGCSYIRHKTWFSPSFLVHKPQITYTYKYLCGRVRCVPFLLGYGDNREIYLSCLNIKFHVDAKSGVISSYFIIIEISFIIVINISFIENIFTALYVEWVDGWVLWEGRMGSINYGVVKFFYVKHFVLNLHK